MITDVDILSDSSTRSGLVRTSSNSCCQLCCLCALCVLSVCAVCCLCVLCVLGFWSVRRAATNEKYCGRRITWYLINSKKVKEKQWSTRTLHAQGKYKYNTFTSDLSNIIQLHPIPSLSPPYPLSSLLLSSPLLFSSVD